jgi:hypothetical protein
MDVIDGGGGITSSGSVATNSGSLSPFAKTTSSRALASIPGSPSGMLSTGMGGNSAGLINTDKDGNNFVFSIQFKTNDKAPITLSTNHHQDWQDWLDGLRSVLPQYQASGSNKAGANFTFFTHETQEEVQTLSEVFALAKLYGPPALPLTPPPPKLLTSRT